MGHILRDIKILLIPSLILKSEVYFERAKYEVFKLE